MQIKGPLNKIILILYQGIYLNIFFLPRRKSAGIVTCDLGHVTHDSCYVHIDSAQSGRNQSRILGLMHFLVSLQTQMIFQDIGQCSIILGPFGNILLNGKALFEILSISLKLSSCPLVLLSSCPPVLMFSCPRVLVPSCPPVLLYRGDLWWNRVLLIFPCNETTFFFLIFK